MPQLQVIRFGAPALLVLAGAMRGVQHVMECPACTAAFLRKGSVNGVFKRHHQ